MKPPTILRSWGHLRRGPFDDGIAGADDRAIAVNVAGIVGHAHGGQQPTQSAFLAFRHSLINEIRHLGHDLLVLAFANQSQNPFVPRCLIGVVDGFELRIFRVFGFVGEVAMAQ